jgi:hypothetical protein
MIGRHPMSAEEAQAILQAVADFKAALRPGGVDRYRIRTSPGDPFEDEQYRPIGPAPGLWPKLVRLITRGAYGQTWAWVRVYTSIPRHFNCRCVIR